MHGRTKGSSSVLQRRQASGCWRWHRFVRRTRKFAARHAALNARWSSMRHENGFQTGRRYYLLEIMERAMCSISAMTVCQMNRGG